MVREDNTEMKPPENICQKEETVRKKLDAAFEPEEDLSALELGDIIDCDSLQSMMEDFYSLTNIGSAIVDLKGKILVAVGWQDVCVKFHRVHPETLKNCIESDIILTRGVPAGTYKTYRCKNNMWDMATPIEVEGRHLGNIFIGQFFYENEIPDYDLFRDQARQYGFDEQQYLESIDRVPRWSRETINTAMTFCAKLAKMISSLSYSAIRLSQVLSEHEKTLHKLSESEQRLKLAQMATNDVIWDWDIINDSQQWNASGSGVFGWDDIVDHPQTAAWWVKRIHPEDRQRVEEGFFEIVDDPGKNRWQDEYRFLKADGSYAQVMDRGYVMRNSHGEAIRMIGAMLDITERIRAEAALKQLNETLEQKVAERTRLSEARAKQLQNLAVDLINAEEKERQRLAELLHEDLQQILASAKMHLQFAYQDGANDPKVAGVMKMLDDSIKKTRQLSHELNPPTLHRFGLIQALKWLFQQMKKQFGLEIDFEIKSSRQFKNKSLKICMFRSVQEILFNVAKHAGVNSARVVFSSTDDSIVVTISDQGRGFNPDILETSDVQHGLGLLCLRERAQTIGGSLKIESAPGQGSKFTLTIPCRVDQAVKPGKIEEVDHHEYTPEGTELSSKSGLRVLFVDDHKVMRQGLISLISGQPEIQSVGEAANGLEAIEKARELYPDVIVMDVSMPKMDGVEATRRIKSSFPKIRVIGLSMYQDEFTEQTMLEAGAETFLSKTAAPSELLKAIYGIRSGAQE